MEDIEKLRKEKETLKREHVPDFAFILLAMFLVIIIEYPIDYFFPHTTVFLQVLKLIAMMLGACGALFLSAYIVGKGMPKRIKEIDDEIKVLLSEQKTRL